MKTTRMEQYIDWRGDLLFAEDGFQTADNIILSELAYLDLRPVFPEGSKKEMTLQECAEIISRTNSYCLKTVTGGMESFVYKACACPRYKDVIVRRYLDIYEEEKDMQLAAVEFVLNDDLSYVGFRGTDSTLTGWKEDFMLSFTETAGQIYASVYLNRMLEEDREFYVGGHSKGGNLALYACASLPEEKRKKISRIYLNDAPGLAEEIMSPEKYQDLATKIIRFVPSFGLIGRLFPLSCGELHIVKCTEESILSHDLSRWKILGSGVEEADRFNAFSDYLCRAINEWIEKIPQDEREQFVEEVFNALSAGGAETIQEIAGKGFLQVLKKAAASSDVSRKTALELIRTAVLSGIRKDTENRENEV